MMDPDEQPPHLTDTPVPEPKPKDFGPVTYYSVAIRFVGVFEAPLGPQDRLHYFADPKTVAQEKFAYLFQKWVVRGLGERQICHGPFIISNVIILNYAAPLLGTVMVKAQVEVLISRMWEEDGERIMTSNTGVNNEEALRRLVLDDIRKVSGTDWTKSDWQPSGLELNTEAISGKEWRLVETTRRGNYNADILRAGIDNRLERTGQTLADIMSKLK